MLSFVFGGVSRATTRVFNFGVQIEIECTTFDGKFRAEHLFWQNLEGYEMHRLVKLRFYDRYASGLPKPAKYKLVVSRSTILVLSSWFLKTFEMIGLCICS